MAGQNALNLIGRFSRLQLFHLGRAEEAISF
jgi:hypothetical protein